MATVIQGYLETKKQGSGSKWKKKYFMLDNGGYLYISDKKGGKSVTVPITPNTQVDSLKSMGEESGISITGANHDPVFARADSPELAEGWLRALQIMKGGGTTANMDLQEEDKQDRLRNAYASANVMGKGGRTAAGTLDRKGKGPRGGTLDRKQVKKKSASKPKPSPAPPAASDSEDDDAAAPAAAPAAASADDDENPADKATTDEDASEEEEEDIPIDNDGNTFEDGYNMHIRGHDYFVDSTGWEYYSSRDAFLGGEKPIGRAILSMLV